MLPRPAATLAIDARIRSARAVIAVATIAILIGGCASADGPTASGAQPAPAGAVAGLCAALAALPDRSAAEQAFINVAHDPLHRLAADPRVDRALAADVLETMQAVEVDLGRSAPVDVLREDLGALRTATGAAVAAIGAPDPGCAT
jgi:hypothetical protein